MQVQVFAYPIMNSLDVQVVAGAATETGRQWTVLYHELLTVDSELSTADELLAGIETAVRLARARWSRPPAL